MLKVVNQGTHVPVVDVVDGVATVESTNIAEVFEKRHDHVLRDIENILISLPSERRDNFIEIQLDRINNFGATVQSKAYRLTRDGFTFLVMGYTGEKAARFKWAYIDEFNRQQTLLESKALLRRNLSELCSREIRLLKTCYEGSPAKWMRRPWATSS